jgi:alkanesulfonate monooxygenase SsuD/methylene tetrahydromethanopterin reductase-like flavin-dependent oxidoreductase (luciferase family)
MVTGESRGGEAALRRAARVADLWLAFDVTPEEFRALHARLRSLAAERTVAAGTVISARAEMDASRLADYIEQWRAAGAEHLAVHPGALETAAERLSSLAEGVPELRVGRQDS